MALKLYGITNCETVKKARAWLDARGIAYDFHDYKKRGVDRSELERWVAEHGWERVLNRAGTTFRKLDPGLTRSLDARTATALMVEHPSSIKRPVAVVDMRVLVGFEPEAYGVAFGAKD
jgi:arsenate reductase